MKSNFETYYTERIEYEDLFWKKQESSLREIRKNIQLIISNLNLFVK